MSGSTAGLLGFTALLLCGLALEAAGRHRRGPATAVQALAATMRTAPGRAAVLAAWVWIGVHFLAR